MTEMSDDWIDKNELQNLISGFTRTSPASQGAEDIFADIPSQSFQEQPALPQQPQNHSPLQVLVNPPVSPHPQAQSPHDRGITSPFELDSSSASPASGQQVYSPFSLDEDEDSYEGIEERIEKLTSEAEKALAALREARLKAHSNGLLPPTEPTVHDNIDSPLPPESGQVASEEKQDAEDEDAETRTAESGESKASEDASGDASSGEAEGESVEPIQNGKLVEEDASTPTETTESEETEEVEEKPSPLDRIPLEVEIDPHLSLKGRLKQLCEILSRHVEMREILVVDRNGFALFETDDSRSVERSVASYLQSIRGIYQSGEAERELSASQLRVGDEEWLCLIPTDGQIKGMFLLKGIVPQPLDRPELYLVIELLNEVLRPDSA